MAKKRTWAGSLKPISLTSPLKYDKLNNRGAIMTKKRKSIKKITNTEWIRKHFGELVDIVWKGGATTKSEVERKSPGKLQCTPENIIELVRKLAKEFDDAQIARVLNRQGRRTGRGNPFTKERIVSLRGKHKIPKSPKKQVKDPRNGPIANFSEPSFEWFCFF